MALQPIITPDQRRLNVLNLILGEFRALKETASVAQVQTFLYVAINEGCSLTDIAKATGWSQSTLSRHLLDLGPVFRDKTPGYQLIQSERDITNLRTNVYTLTPKGHTLLRKVQQLIDTIER